MHLTLLKGNGHFVVWVDKDSVDADAKVERLFGRLSRTLKDAVRTREPITASWETEFNGKEYASPSSEDEARVRVQLKCFKAKLIAEAPN